MEFLYSCKEQVGVDTNRAQKLRLTPTNAVQHTLALVVQVQCTVNLEPLRSNTQIYVPTCDIKITKQI